MMPSNTQMHDAKNHQETLVMGYGIEVKRSSQLQTPKSAKEKVLSPRASRGLKLSEKDKVLKYNQQTVAVENVDARHLFPPKSSGYFQQEKWPKRDRTRVEELVKHMSNVPGYLQHLERGDNIQEKALNFGVLDWRHLEKWTGNPKQVVVNVIVADSPARSDSSSFPMFESTSPSCRRSGSSSSAQKNRSPSLNCHKDLVVEEDHRKTLEEETSRQNTNSEITSRKSLIRRQFPARTNHRLHMDPLQHRLEKSKRKGLDSRVVPHKACRSPETRIWPSTSKSCGTPDPVNQKMKAPDVKSNWGEEKFRELDNKCSGSSFSPRNCAGDHSTGLSRCSDGMSDHHGSRRFSFESTESGNISRTESSPKSFSGNFSSDDFQNATQSPAVPHSCRLPSNIEGSEWSDVNVVASQGDRFSKVPCDPSNFTLHSEAATIVPNGGSDKDNKSTTLPPKLFAAITPDRWGRHGVKTLEKTRRELFPNHQSSAGPSGMIRSSSLRECSATRELKWTTSSDSPNEDKATDSSRARRSPLRRLLDPLLKPKAFSRTHPTDPPAGSPMRPSCELRYAGKPSIQEEFASIHGPHNLSDGSSKYTGQGGKNCTPPSRVPTGTQGSHQDEKHRAPTKQALLQLAWKNGQPLFTFSTNESDILAATRKICISDKDDSQCIYTFYHVREIKKKSGGWIYHGSKNKRQGLISNVVGQMKVLCHKCPKITRNHYKTHSTVTEFVLFGVALRPTAPEVLDPHPKSELAAIIVSAPEESTESSASDFPQNNNCKDPSKNELEKNDYSSHQSVAYSESEQNSERDIPDMVAILPSEVHGFSETGEPSPLIDRWKSGGSCDCGGWDIGCPLTVLISNLQGSRSSSVAQSCCTTDGTHRVELFVQGVGQESRTLFSLVAFRDGLYTVDFQATIAPLQAFAVCVANLHGRKLKPTGLSELATTLSTGTRHCSRNDPNGIQGEEEPPTKYAPYHPPLSPVGRA